MMGRAGERRACGQVSRSLAARLGAASAGVLVAAVLLAAPGVAVPAAWAEQGEQDVQVSQGSQAADAGEAKMPVSVEMSEQGPVVTWEPVAGAVKYEVYRRRSGDSWKKLATLDVREDFQGAYTYVDGDELYAGVKYAYRLRVSTPAPAEQVPGVAGGTAAASTDAEATAGSAASAASSSDAGAGDATASEAAADPGAGSGNVADATATPSAPSAEAATPQAGATGTGAPAASGATAPAESSSPAMDADGSAAAGSTAPQEDAVPAASDKSAEPTIEHAYSESVFCKASAFQKTEPKVKRASRAKTMTVSWATSQYADGYTVEYATSKVFSSPKSVKVKGGDQHKQVIEGISKDKTYYVRVLARQNQGDQAVRSSWDYSSNVRGATTANARRVKVKKSRVMKVRIKVKRTKAQYRRALAKARARAKAKHARLKKPSRYRYKSVKRRYKVKTPYEVASATGQKLGKYDTVQGSCSDGTYAYFVLNNRAANKCRIAKVRLSNMKLAKVSRTLPIGHGSDITYDSGRKRLIVAQGAGRGLVLPTVNAKTLKLQKKVKVKIPKELPGASESQRASLAGASGVSCVAYDAANKQVIAVLTGSRKMLVLSGKLVPKRLALMSEKGNGLRQGAEVVGDMLVVCKSPGTGLAINQLCVYDLGGELVRTVRLKFGNELENVFAVGKRLYTSVYASKYKKHSYSRNNYVYRLNVGVSKF